MELLEWQAVRFSLSSSITEGIVFQTRPCANANGNDSVGPVPSPGDFFNRQLAWTIWRDTAALSLVDYGACAISIPRPGARLCEPQQ
jgi:hypothetical protein